MNNVLTYAGSTLYFIARAISNIANNVAKAACFSANYVAEKYSDVKRSRRFRTVSGTSLKTGNVPGKFKKGRTVFGFRAKWYWDIRLWAPVIVALFFLFLNVFKVTEVQYIEIPVYTSVMAEDAEEVADSVTEEKIISMARLADSVAKGRPEVVKEIILWVLINRVEDRANGYGGTLMEEIARPRQWQEYDSDAVYLDSTYQLAKKVYQTWQSGGARPIYPDMLWFVLNGDGSVTVRNQYKEGKNRVEATFGQ